MVQKLVTSRSFVNGTLAVPGQVANYDERILNGNERNLADPGDAPRLATVAMSAIAPTGPNPTAPQQISPDTIQTAGGYVKPGAQVVGEGAPVPDVRKGEATAEGDLARQLREAQAENARLRAEARQNAGRAPGEETRIPAPTPAGDNADDALVDGTIPEVTANLGEKTDDQLRAMRAAEIDREKPRKGVTSAIDEELKRREEAAMA